MRLRFFAIPALDPSAAEDELNRLLAAGRKIDYREILNAADFAVFARLRAERKAIAEAEGVPAYAVFTNEQLAAMVTGRVSTAEGLLRIEGVGTARVERYAERFLALLNAAQASGPPPA